MTAKDDQDSPLRPPPAYQEYAADLIAMEAVRTMTLAERGLMATMRWMAWANDDLPADPIALARLLGFDLRTLRANLTPRVLAFFSTKEGDESRLICPELVDQKVRLMARRKRLSEAGKDGREKQLSEQATPQATPRATPRATPEGLRGPSEKKRTEPLRKASDVSSEDVLEYQRAFGERA